MNCDDVKLGLADFATGRSSSSAALAIDQHLSSCADCREDRDQILRLYALDLDLAPPATLARAGRLDLGGVRTAFFRRPLPRIAAATLLVLLGVGAAAFQLGRTSRGREGDPGGGATRVDGSAHLRPIQLEIPEVPPAWAESVWFADERNAERFAAYSGRPLLREYAFAECPRCQQMKARFEGETFLEEAHDFILVRRLVAFDRVPEELDAVPSALPKTMMLPAVIISSGANKVGPLFEISSLESVYDLFSAWDEAAAGRAPALDRETYELCRDAFATLAGRLEAHDYRGVFSSLEKIAGLGATRTTKFAEDARALLLQLEAGIEAEISTIMKALAGLDGAERNRGRAEGRLLLAAIEGLPAAHRLRTALGD